MGHGVHARTGRQRRRQAQRQQRIVDHRARQHAQVAPGLLEAAVGDAVDRRHLGTGVSGRHRHDGQGRGQRDGLARPMVEPPPTATQQSAPRRAASARAASADSSGTCITAPGCTPAAHLPGPVPPVPQRPLAGRGQPPARRAPSAATSSGSRASSALEHHARRQTLVDEPHAPLSVPVTAHWPLVTGPARCGGPAATSPCLVHHSPGAGRLPADEKPTAGW